MAKVTITLEDIERDGKPSIRVGIKTDNAASEEHTNAEVLAGELFEAVVQLAAVMEGKPHVQEDNPNKENMN